MANEVLYVRNTRPNAVLVKYNDIKYTVERRGSREDTTALPADAKFDPVVASFITRGILEEISKDAFYALEARNEGRPAYALKKGGEEVNLPMSHAESRTPMLIADDVITQSRHLRSPHPEFAERVLSTGEEMATGVRQPLPELEKNRSSLSVDKVDPQIEQLTGQVAALSGLVEQLLASQAASQVQTKEPAKGATTEPKAKRTTTKKK